MPGRMVATTQKSLPRRINARRTNAERGDDAYWTLPCAVHSLMALERLTKSIAGPCCGNGAILDVLARGGHILHGADAVDYGWRPGCTVIRDYLAEPIDMNGVGIVTNPPYKLALEFIEKAIRRLSVSCMAAQNELSGISPAQAVLRAAPAFADLDLLGTDANAPRGLGGKTVRI